jgi:hypothetical protein
MVGFEALGSAYRHVQAGLQKGHRGRNVDLQAAPTPWGNTRFSLPG